MDEGTVQNETAISVGMDLYGVSVGELRDRIALFKAETLRLEAELEKKQSGLAAAEALFSPKS